MLLNVAFALGMLPLGSAPLVHASLATGSANAVVGQYGADNLPSFSKGMGTFSGVTNAGASNVTNTGFGNIISQQTSYAKPVIDETAHRLYVADAANNRIVWYDLTTGNTLIDLTQDGVIGQSDGFTANPNHGTVLPAANGLMNPDSVAVDGAGHVWVADTRNNRVLRFTNPVGDGSDAADMVLGQSSFTTNGANRSSSVQADTLNGPTDLTVSGNAVWITDTGNNRIVMYASPVGDGSDAASKVVGQPSFTSSGSGLTAGRLSTPVGIMLIGTDVWVSDRINNRVLRFANPVGDGTDVANAVLGQSDFISSNRTRPAQNALTGPTHLSYDATGQRIFISEYSGHRVTGWSLPISGDGSGESAAMVVGQSGYTTSVNGGGSSNSSVAETASSLSFPNGVAWAATTNTLYVLDSGNARLLSYASPAGTGQAATQQAGQANFTSHFSNGDFRSLSTQQGGLAVDRTRHLLYVSDTSNQRIVMYQLDSSNQLADGNPDGVIGQPNLISNTRNRGGSTVANGLGAPSGLQLDASGNLWVVDNLNSRIIRFPTPAGDGSDSADRVVGQANLTSGSLNRGGSPAANSLRNPTYLAFDAANNLWVVDFGNNRIVRYSTLVGDGSDVADKVLGQANFASNSANRGGSTAANSFNLPNSIAFDSGGNAWITDTLNHRVVRYSTLVGDGSDAADKVVGQANFTSGLANRGGTTAANSLYNPTILAIDTNDYLWIEDSANSRLLRYGAITGDGSDAAVKVIGQSDFTTGSQNRGNYTAAANSMSNPYGLLIQPEGTWVGERLNQRVTFFAAGPTVPGTPASSDPSTDLTPTVSWSASTDADHYEVQWSTDSGFTSGVISSTASTPSCALSTTACGNPTGLADGTWYVRVRAVDVDGISSVYSASGLVTVQAAPTPSPTASPTGTPSSAAPVTPGGASGSNQSTGSGLPGSLAKSGPALLLYLVTVVLVSLGYKTWRRSRVK